MTDTLATWVDETEAEVLGEGKNADAAEETPDAAKEKRAETKTLGERSYGAFARGRLSCCVRLV